MIITCSPVWLRLVTGLNRTTLFSYLFILEKQCYKLMLELLLLFFCLFQVIIQSGQPPTVLQQLCALPFHYFSDPRLVAVLFPTLICCCYKNSSNRDILEQELSCNLLSSFIEVGFVCPL